MLAQLLVCCDADIRKQKLLKTETQNEQRTLKDSILTNIQAYMAKYLFIWGHVEVQTSRTLARYPRGWPKPSERRSSAAAHVSRSFCRWIPPYASGCQPTHALAKRWCAPQLAVLSHPEPHTATTSLQATARGIFASSRRNVCTVLRSSSKQPCILLLTIAHEDLPYQSTKTPQILHCLT